MCELTKSCVNQLFVWINHVMLQNGLSALFFAIKGEHLDVVKAFISSAAQLNKSISKVGLLAVNWIPYIIKSVKHILYM